MALGMAAQQQWDRRFFLAFVLLGWLAIYMAFAGESLKRLHGHADYPAPPILQIHIASFIGWMLLLTTQVLLIRYRRHAVHRRLGMALLALVPVMVVSGIGAEVVSQRFYSPRYPANLGFFGHPLQQMLTFPICALAAWHWRRDSPMHKRLILAATTVLMSAAYFRWWGDTLFDVFGEGFAGRWIANYVGPALLLLTGMGYDLLTRGKVHRAYALAVPLIVAGQLAAVALSFGPGWRNIVGRLVGV